MRRCCCRHRATDTDNAPEAAGRRGGRAAATFAVGVLHDVETRRASRGRRARRRRSPRPQPLQLPLPRQLSLPSCTTALARTPYDWGTDVGLLDAHMHAACTTCPCTSACICGKIAATFGPTQAKLMAAVPLSKPRQPTMPSSGSQVNSGRATTKPWRIQATPPTCFVGSSGERS